MLKHKAGQKKIAPYRVKIFFDPDTVKVRVKDLETLLQKIEENFPKIRGKNCKITYMEGNSEILVRNAEQFEDAINDIEESKLIFKCSTCSSEHHLIPSLSTDSQEFIPT